MYSAETARERGKKVFERSPARVREGVRACREEVASSVASGNTVIRGRGWGAVFQMFVYHLFIFLFNFFIHLIFFYDTKKKFHI